MIVFHARRFDTGEPVRVTVSGRFVAAVEPAVPAGDAADWPLVAPGLFDLQINGLDGQWFAAESLTPESVLVTLEGHYRLGVTRLCPTLITNSFAALEAGFHAIRAACDREPWAHDMVPGCHLEGPYISAEDGPRGAHPLSQVRGCDWDEFSRLQNASGNRIRLLTLAPESPGAVEFIRRAVASGVTVALGHTAADTTQIAAAVDAGAKLSTHLGNGSHTMLRRHPNYIWDQLGEPRLWASIITDGFHLPASVIRSIVATKGQHRTIITCDASGFAGCTPGTYDYEGSQYEVLSEGAIVVAGQRQILAGSAQSTPHCVAHAAAVTGLPLGRVWDMASRNPARLLGFEALRLARGSRADLVVFDHDPAASRIIVRGVVAAGRVVHGATEIKTLAHVA
ncbi:MAG: amidohydrolase family protein [Planctomycetaceae bacterium]|nr:amidohydrolase family protein [Planctomycetaceae bacterium]